jgi:hypothetical protein
MPTPLMRSCSQCLSKPRILSSLSLPYLSNNEPEQTRRLKTMCALLTWWLRKELAWQQ